jgi:predicted exporter
VKTALARVAVLALFAALALFCARRLDFGTDITNFMPDGRHAELAALARHLARSDVARTMFLTVGTASGRADDERIARVVARLKQELASDPEIEWLRSGPEDQDLEEVWKVYFPRRFALASLEPEKDIPALVTPEAIAKAAERAREALASPTAALVKRTIGADPLGLASTFLERMREESPAMEVRQGTFFSRDGWGVLMLATRPSAFDASRQAPLLAAIEARFDAIRASEGGDLLLEKSGANRFAVDAERSMKRDMGWISATAFTGITVLVLAYFRSPLRFAVAMLPTVGGLLVATAAGLLVFGRLDGLTIAFGASLIGVAIDYPVHLLNHLTVLGGSKRDAVRALAPSLAMGALTTVAGFAGLSLTSFPGFREIGFFAAVGVASALAWTLTVVPLFLGETQATSRVPGATARFLGVAVRAALRRPRAMTALPLLALVLGAVALPGLAWQDDLSKLGNVNPALEQEEKRVHARVLPYEMGRVVLVTGDDEQQALERSEDVARTLAALQRDGAVRGYRSVTNLLRSSSLQERNLAVFRAQTDLAARVRAGFAQAGFRPEAFDAFARDLGSEAAPPMTAADLAGTALARMLAPLRMDLDGRSATITQVADPRDEAAVRTALAAVPGAHYFVQREFVNDLYAQFRDSTLEQLLLGALLVVFALAVRYRKWRPTLAAALPTVLVPVLVLSGLSLAGEPVNLLHVVSLLMVTGMGVDYAIFLVDSAGDREHLETTLVSLLLCWLTTVFGFAVVALSSHPALRAMGLTIGVGVTLSLLLSPVSLVVLGRRDADGVER